MNAVKIFCVLALVMALVVLPLRAQQPGGQSFSPAPDNASAGDAVNGGSKDYPLGPGDVVELRVFGETQFDGPYSVDEDGFIRFPFLEAIDARCKQVNEVRKEVITQLAKFLRSPQVYLRVREQNSRPAAFVYGAVKVPLQFKMHRRARLLELIANSGGVTDQASGSIQITHMAAAVCPEPDEVTEAKTSVQGVDALGIPFSVYKVADLKLGKSEANPFIRPGDIIYVAEAAPVYVIGAVNAPQGIYLHENMTLSRAIAMVNGIKKEAKSGEVRIHRLKEGSVEREIIVADYRKIQRNQEKDILLQPYDVIEVPEKGFSVGDFFKNAGQIGINSVMNGAGTRILY